MNTKPIENWRTVFLDTSIIIDRMKLGANDARTNARIQFTHKLLDYLSDNSTAENKKGESFERIFYISSISVAEFRMIKEDEGLHKLIAQTLKTSNVEFLPFNNKVALHFNHIFSSLVQKKELTLQAKDLDLMPDNLAEAREWLFRDYMILATASYYKADIVLTADEKVFLETAKKAGIPCLPNNSEHPFFNAGLFPLFG